MTIDMIRSSQQGNPDATLQLLQKFNPLLKKYARKLGYEDAFSDLQADFLELLTKMKTEKLHNQDEAIAISYISTAVRNDYIKRLNKLKLDTQVKSISELNDGEKYFVEVSVATYDKPSELNYTEISSCLTAAEWSIIYAVYFQGYSTAEISRKKDISRQTVNQTKLRGLAKLRTLYCGRCPDHKL